LIIQPARALIVIPQSSPFPISPANTNSAAADAFSLRHDRRNRRVFAPEKCGEINKAVLTPAGLPA
jgi:hypothetical protein